MLHCEVCKKEVSTRGSTRFCSQQCYWKSKQGVPLSEEHKENMRGKRYSYGNGKVMSEETKQKLSKAMVGKRHTPETIARISATKMGHIVTDEARANISKGRKGVMMGENHFYWKGGISLINKRVRRMPEYLEWRAKVFERDLYTCQKCKKSGIYITAHHIVSLTSIVYDNGIEDITMARDCSKLWDLDNGITLCEECHSKTDNYKGRGQLNKLSKISS
jgi:NUMOD3 motif